ncbi:MAG: putative flavoprotein involved in transport [Solirubrobacteraceae bacterium]|nr:putative flavoprotein involved in transport [Solirubrobacteraceae bacterium]
MPTTDTVIIGAGQAGLALSRQLSGGGHDHVVLERGRIGERWRSERWPSLRLLTPNWLNRLPGAGWHPEPDGFMPIGAFVGELEAYARSFGAPVRERHPVGRVAPAARGYHVYAGDDVWAARNVVIATGDCDRPAVPAVATVLPPRIVQLHSSEYRTPRDLPDGAVLVVGAGASGQQIADELRRAGRRVVLAAGAHSRMVRRYRGRDSFAWLAMLGKLDERVGDVRDPAAARLARSPALTGARGGEELDLGVLHAEGVEVTGRLLGVAGGRARFADDLPETVARADATLARVLTRIDAYVAAAPGLADTPPGEPVAPVACGPGARSVDLRGFGAVVWATGYRRAYPWLRVPVLDPRGELVHDRGATSAPGLHVLGLRFQQRRASHLIGGVGVDATDLAERLGALTAARPGAGARRPGRGPTRRSAPTDRPAPPGAAARRAA